jgi:selenide,water dikinase
VYRLAPDLCLVQTVDFFTPIVDDPYDFGRIAAVNALSDVYAMGGRPVSAVNLAAFPHGDDPGPAVLARILQGGLDALTAAGVALLGGHTIDDAEPKFGLAVTGIARPEEIRTKAGARPGDRLLLTKPIGVGAYTTALKRGRLDDAEVAAVTALMLRPNDQLDVIRSLAVHAATDVTGFGLLGHLLEVCRRSGTGARLSAGAVPSLPRAEALVADGVVPDGSRSNLAHVRPFLRVSPDVGASRLQLLADAVTSGGLLLTIAPDAAQAVAARLVALGAVVAADVGEVVAADAPHIEVTA